MTFANTGAGGPHILQGVSRRQYRVALYNEQGWEPSVKDGAFTAAYSAPSAGPPPWDLYAMTPVTMFGVATAEPYGATRWRFGG